MEDPEHNVDMESRVIIRNLIEQLTSEGTAVLLTTTFLKDAISITDHVYRLNESELKKIETPHEVEDKWIDARDVPIESDRASNSGQQPIRFEKIPAKVTLHLHPLARPCVRRRKLFCLKLVYKWGTY